MPGIAARSVGPAAAVQNDGPRCASPESPRVHEESAVTLRPPLQHRSVPAIAAPHRHSKRLGQPPDT
jgi:hypothetical protein